MHQGIHAVGFGAIGAHLGYQFAGKLAGGGAFGFGHLGALQHIGYGFGFVAAIGLGDGLAQGGLGGVGKLEHGGVSLSGGIMVWAMPNCVSGCLGRAVGCRAA